MADKLGVTVDYFLYQVSTQAEVKAILESKICLQLSQKLERRWHDTIINTESSNCFCSCNVHIFNYWKCQEMCSRETPKI